VSHRDARCTIPSSTSLGTAARKSAMALSAGGYQQRVRVTGQVPPTESTSQAADGVTQVMSHGEPMPKMLAVNRLNDSFSASAASSVVNCFLRGERHLYCIAEE
jgi:hypothetical protein